MSRANHTPTGDAGASNRSVQRLNALSESPLESDTERYLVRRVHALGGECLKIASPGNAGVLDRLVMLPGEVMCFVEVKRLGEGPSKLQRRFLRRMHALSVPAAIVDSREAADALLRDLERLHA